MGDRPGGILLPTLGVPIDVQLRHHLAVYFRPLSSQLEVACVNKDTRVDLELQVGARADPMVHSVGRFSGWPIPKADSHAALQNEYNSCRTSAESGQPVPQMASGPRAIPERSFLAWRICPRTWSNRTSPKANGVVTRLWGFL